MSNINQCFPQVTLASTLTFEEFKVAILEDIGFPSISDINFKVTPFTSLPFLFDIFRSFPTTENCSFAYLEYKGP